MDKPFRRNLSKYRVRGDHSRAAKLINDHLAKCMVVSKDGLVSHNLGPLDIFRALTDEEALAVFLLGYEHFLWLIDQRHYGGKKFSDNIYYASGLDFAVQILARKRNLPFGSADLSRLMTAYLTHPGPTP